MAVQLKRKAESLCKLDAEERQQLFTLRVLSAQYDLAIKAGDKVAQEYKQEIISALTKVDAKLCNIFLLDMTREARNDVLNGLQQMERQSAAHNVAM